MTQRAEHNTLKIACESLALILSAHLSVVKTLLAQPGKCGAKVLRAARDVSRTVTRQLKIQHKLLSQVLRSDLRSRPAMRARVAYDLGGTMALIKWERRQRDAKTHRAFLAARRAQGLGSVYEPVAPNPDKAPTELRETNTIKPRKIWQPKTDRTGNFRLARIAAGTKLKTITTRIVRRPRRAPRPFQLIEVTSSELRVRAFLAMENNYPPRPDIGRPAAGRSPPIDRPPIN